MLLLNDYVFGKELFIRFTVRVSHERFFQSFPFGFRGGMWDLIV